MKFHFKNILFILIGLIVVNTIQAFVLHILRQFGDFNFYNFGTHIFNFVNGVLSIISTIVAWRLLYQFSKKKRAFFTFLTSILIFSLLTTIYFFTERNIFNALTTSVNMLIGNVITTLIITHLHISAYTIAYLYFVHSRDLEVDVERLENEKLQLNSNLLKQNLEPHFLFNNLSVLSGLMKKNPEKVEDFMDSFSQVYRYYLKHSQSNTVSISEELIFLQHYMELMNSRFGNAYQIKIDVNDEKGFLLPCSLQLCVENAIKHNKASEYEPLLIEIYRENNVIIVKNPIRKVDFTVSNGVGNDYLKRRYAINFNKEVNTEISDNQYFVKIPIV